MSGMLNSKNRVLDVVLTELGRKQMDKGQFEVSFVSFSDKCTEYLSDDSGVAIDIKDRVYFEAFSSPSDEIIPEIDDIGNFILTKQVSPTLTVNNGVLYEKIDSGYQEVDGFSQVSKFTSLTTGRFNGLQILRTENNTPDFDTNVAGAKMAVPTEVVKLPDHVSGLKPILVDPRFSGTINTMFLPPKVRHGLVEAPLRAYNRFGKEHSQKSLVEEIKNSSYSKATIELGGDKYYKEYNLLGQIFMKKDQTIRKYLLIDAGEYKNKDQEISMQIYHCGFIFKDENGTSKFSRAFSIIFHNGEDV